MAAMSSPVLEELVKGSAKVKERLEGEMMVLKREMQGIEAETARIESETARQLRGGDDASAEVVEEPKASDLLRLNVGGDTSFVARRDTLTAVSASRLARLFGGRFDAIFPKDADGKLFLDLDPLHFRTLIGWLTHVKRVGPAAPLPPLPTGSLPKDRRWGFPALAQFLGLVAAAQPDIADGSVPLVGAAADAHGSLLTQEARMTLMRFLMEDRCVGPPSSKRPKAAAKAPGFTLLYRSSRDGSSPRAFHEKCDSKGATVVLARSAAGHIFGGYSDVPWASNDLWCESQASFLFRLSGPEGIPASKHPVYQHHKKAIYSYASSLPTFGGEDLRFTSGPQEDLRFTDQGNQLYATMRLGHTYNSDSFAGSFTRLAESPRCHVTELEVYRVDEVRTLPSTMSKVLECVDSWTDSMTSERRECLKEALELASCALEGKEAVLAEKERLQTLAAQSAGAAADLAFFKHFLPEAPGSEIITLSVGGLRYAAFRSTLTRSSASILAAKFGDSWSLQTQELDNGAVFIDEDPVLFETVLQYLRLAGMAASGVDAGAAYISSSKKEALLSLLEYWSISGFPLLQWDSTIARTAELQSSLQSMLAGGVAHVSLLYRASRDGFSPRAFHERCDAKGPTLVLARSAAGHIFGGYSDVSWSSSAGNCRSRAAFLFRLAGPGPRGHTPSKHELLEPGRDNAIHCSSECFPSFGSRCSFDLTFMATSRSVSTLFATASSRSAKRILACMSLGRSYDASSAVGPVTSLAESQECAVTELEVFGVRAQGAQNEECRDGAPEELVRTPSRSSALSDGWEPIDGWEPFDEMM